MGVTLGARPQMYLGWKHKRGPGKPIFESTCRPDIHRKSGKTMELVQIIDRENDHYKEIVKDPATGEVVHSCEESLSQHRGHGSAKHR